MSVLYTCVYEFSFIVYFPIKNILNIDFVALAMTRGPFCRYNTRREWPNTHTHTYESAHTQKEKSRGRGKREDQEGGGEE